MHEVVSTGTNWIVMKDGEQVHGGCHASKAAADQHMAALEAGVPPVQAGAVLDTSHLTVVRNVEIMKTGIEYQLSTGKTTFTAEELADAVAALDDPTIVTPRLKIGHTDERFTGDGEPSLGRVTNLRLTDSGHTIVGDYIGVPKWLAGIMASAYPSRSVEGNWNVEGTGKKWKFVITACSLLGVQWPGISTLDDLPILYSEEGPEGVTVNGEPMEVVMAAAAPVAAAVNVDDVRQQYYQSRTNDQNWWWIRAIYLNPDELIVDDDEGQLYRIPFAVNGDEVAYGDPAPVKIVYEDVSAQVAASMYVQGVNAERGERVAAQYKTREESGAQVAAQKGEGMDPEVLKALGLPEDATPEQAQQVLRDRGFSAEVEDPPAPEGDPEDTQGAQERQPEPDIVQLAASRGLALVDEGMLKEMQEGAKTAQALAAQQQQNRKAEVLAAAMNDGKFPPARKEHWERLYDADPEGTEQTLAALAENIVPVTERGHAAGGGADATDDAYPLDWFPEVAARKAAQSLPGSGQVLREEVVK